MTLRSSRRMVRKSSSVSRWNDCAQVAVEVGRIGPRVLQLAQEQPLPGEVGRPARRRADRPASAAPAARASPGPSSAPRRRHVEQLVVRDAAPQEERQPRRQLEIAEPVRGARRDVGRLALEAEEELRIDEHARQRALDARTRTMPAVRPARRTRAACRSRRRRRRPAADTRASPACDRICRAHGSSSAGDAGVQTSSRRRLGVSPGPVALKRAGDGDLRDARRARLDVEDAVGAGRRAARRRGAAAMVCGPAGTRSRVAPRPCSVDARAVDAPRTDRRRAGPPPAGRRAAPPPACADLQVVLGVERERVPDDDAAARAERQALDVRVLRQVAGHAVDGAIETDRRIADRQPADLARPRRRSPR